MDVKERQLMIAAILTQSAQDPTEEPDMSYVSERETEGITAAASPISAFRKRIRFALRKILRFDCVHRSCALHLNARLRRDVGMDDIELERQKLEQAPLIR